MTTYTLKGTPGQYNWGDPTSWLGGVVPNGPTADVVFPSVILTSTGQAVASQVGLNGGSYTIRSLAINSNDLDVNGTLAVSGALNVPSNGAVTLDGSLSVGSLSNAGSLATDDGQTAQLTSSGSFVNSGTIGRQSFGSIYSYETPVGTPITLAIQAASFSNTGSIAGASIRTAAGGFLNLAGGTLSGGTFIDPSLNVGATIVTLATNLTLLFDPAATGYASGPADEEFDSATASYIPIESTLRTVAASGVLTVSSYTTTTLTIDGTLDATRAATIQADHLTVDAGGIAKLQGTVTAAVTDNGLIKTAARFIGIGPAESIPFMVDAPLVIDGALTGSGTLEIDAPTTSNGGPTTVELKGPASVAVAFDTNDGVLTIDQPDAFTGTIVPSGSGDIINLAGVSFASVTSKTYTGDASGGTLTLNESNGSVISLRFAGAYNAASFTLSNGQVYSTSPPSLNIAIGNSMQTGNAFYVDGSQGVQNFVGTGNPNFINTAGASGAGTVVVDLPRGIVTKGGQTDAIFSNIQGVQLGGDPSVVLGLASGTDLLYGGRGAATFVGQGGTDDIVGAMNGTLISISNTIIGGSGDEVFTSNGGVNAMRGGTAINRMDGGSPSGAHYVNQDTFYGTTGDDFVYGHGSHLILVAGTGNEFMSGGSGVNELYGATHTDAQGHLGLTYFVGGSGTDLFVASVGTNVFQEGSGTDIISGTSGTDFIQGGSGQAAAYGGSGTDVITTGAGSQYVKAGSGHLYFNDVADHLTAGRFDQIDNFAGSGTTDLYLPSAVQSSTSFIAQNSGTAVLTSVAGGTAEVFAGGADVATVQAHTHFTL